MCSLGFTFYVVRGGLESTQHDVGLVMTKEDGDISSRRIGWICLKYFGRGPQFITGCLKGISSYFDGEIYHLKDNNDWEKNPVCVLKYDEERGTIEVDYPKDSFVI